jgi:phosphoadenosine phosphosulfate reductase
MFENAPIGGGLAKVNPIAYWTFEDTFDYLAKFKVPAHPLHAKGYPRASATPRTPSPSPKTAPCDSSTSRLRTQKKISE